MKHVFKFLLTLFVFAITLPTMAQTNTIVTTPEPVERNYFQLSPRIGYDFPTYNNSTPYIDYKGGLDLGISLDYYWNWFGLGVDFDYIKNKPKNTYPTSNLYEPAGALINSFSLSEDKITRLFYGIGPNIQFRNKSGKFKTELNTRFGLASIKGGSTKLEGSSPTTTYPLNFHTGYKDSGVLTFKGQIRFTYFLSKNFGINAGAYYMRHFDVEELSDGGVSAYYQPFSIVPDNASEPINQLDEENLVMREKPCDCDISSVGLFAGVTFKFSKKENKCHVCKEDHMPHCCATCSCGVTVTAKDKFTGEILPYTDVVLADLDGNIVQSGTTNSYGVAVFNEVAEDNYIIKGKLYDIALEDGSIAQSEFINCQKNSAGIQKEILYGDQNFILRGNVVECNTDEGIQSVDIMLKDKLKAGQKNTLSDAEGDFIFHIKQASTYALNGKKDGYYSNEVEVSTSSYNRDTTLFIPFEMCVDPCGKAIKLDNINFDLDKANILTASIPDLQRVLKLMQDNPSISVEMSSHTDSQGGDSYNLALSQRRADATVNYLASKGVSLSRLIARGAGETELKNKKCANNIECSDKEHRVNRRTEFKVICAN